MAMIKAGEELNLRRVSLPHALLDNRPDPHAPPSIETPATSAPICCRTRRLMMGASLSVMTV